MSFYSGLKRVLIGESLHFLLQLPERYTLLNHDFYQFLLRQVATGLVFLDLVQAGR